MKKISSLVLFLLLFVLLTGCDSSEKVNDPEIMQKMINRTVEVTQKAIQTKDIRTVREIWGQISEYGIKANEMGKKDLAESLGQLASTYVYLVDYIEKGDKNKLILFNAKFDHAVAQLKRACKFVNEENNKK